MTDIWEERKKALENEYFHRKEKEQLEKLKSEQQTRNPIRNCCPKCGETLRAMTFRGVPLDKCPECAGVWLGLRDLHALAEKDHRTWFDKWFKQESGEEE
ncbi:MAG: zf-TFIIB domain-containing protein [Desulfuromonadales bacterium]|jgi:Zn-finger nucleic acid-binding protein